MAQGTCCACMRNWVRSSLIHVENKISCCCNFRRPTERWEAEKGESPEVHCQLAWCTLLATAINYETPCLKEPEDEEWTSRLSSDLHMCTGHECSCSRVSANAREWAYTRTFLSKDIFIASFCQRHIEDRLEQWMLRKKLEMWAFLPHQYTAIVMEAQLGQRNNTTGPVCWLK